MTFIWGKKLIKRVEKKIYCLGDEALSYFFRN